MGGGTDQHAGVQRRFVHVGNPLLRPEDLPLVTGTAHFVADLAPVGRCDAVFVRSFAAHGELRSLDVSGARTAVGVLGVYGASDLASVPVVPSPRAELPALMARPTLAGDRVRFVGEPVALIVAENRYLAEDAAALVELDIEPLEVVCDVEAALAAGAPELYPGHSNVALESEIGVDCADALARSAVVIDAVVDNQRVSPMSLEARAILVEPVAGGLRVYCSHQAPHRLRDALARVLGYERSAIHVTVPFVGGAFGAKSQIYPEYLAVAAAALALGRPVRWIEDRSEAFTAGTHGRGQRTRLRLGCDEDGRFLALDADILADVGAYPDTGGFLARLTAMTMSGVYAIPALHLRLRSVVTNTTPTASYRGAGRPEAAFSIERIVDLAAERLGMDAIEIRRRNFIAEDAFPYRSPTGVIYDSGRYESALDTALSCVDLGALRAEQRRRRVEGAPRLLGIGVATWIERSGGEADSTEYAEVSLSETGELIARIGTATQGQGHQIAFAQVVAEATGVDPSAVSVRIGDTNEVPEGTGSFASRSMQVGGTSAYLAARELMDRAEVVAAELVGGEPGQLRREAGRFIGPTGEAVSLAEIGQKHGPLRCEHRFASPQAFPFGCYLAVVEVERESGDVAVRRLVAVDDVGVVVNPMLVEGQIVGSIAQGLGQALYEQARYDEYGNPVTATLLDYHVPTVAEMPPIVLCSHVTPNPNVPLGTKGAGESGTIGTPPAVANALFDALADYDTSGLGMPFTSARVWACLQRPRRR